jgi:hypothetical protein
MLHLRRISENTPTSTDYHLLYQLNQFGRHRSQALQISEKFRKSQVTEGLSESVPDIIRKKVFDN